MTIEVSNAEARILEKIRIARDYSDIKIEKRAGKLVRILIEESELLASIRKM